MKHTRRCVGVWPRWQYVPVAHQGVVKMTWDQCLTCHTWLPLGPAKDSGVAVEVRAAELALEYSPARGTSDQATMNEDIGWLRWTRDPTEDLEPLNDEQIAGYLARAIYDHDKEQSPSSLQLGAAALVEVFQAMEVGRPLVTRTEASKEGR